MNPFDYLNSINKGVNGEDYFSAERLRSEVRGETVEDYNCFIINRGLSYHSDSVLLANEMNRLPDLPHIMQFDFYRNILRPRKRFAKWSKTEHHDDLEAVVQYFGYSYEKAKQVMDILSSQQIKDVKKKLEKGGLKK